MQQPEETTASGSLRVEILIVSTKFSVVILTVINYCSLVADGSLSNCKVRDIEQHIGYSAVDICHTCAFLSQFIQKFQSALPMKKRNKVLFLDLGWNFRMNYRASFLQIGNYRYLREGNLFQSECPKSLLSDLSVTKILKTLPGRLGWEAWVVLFRKILLTLVILARKINNSYLYRPS